MSSAESPPPIPSSPEAVDPPWLRGALAERHPGVVVRGVEIIERHEVTNAHARLRLTYDEAAGAPEVLFCKLPPTDPARRATINAGGMGRREASFYGRLADQLDLRTPEVHAALLDEQTGEFALLLEDLPSTGCRVSDGPTGVPVDAAAGALEDLAQMHARYEDPQRRAAEAGWVPVLGKPSSYGADLLRFGLDNNRERLSDQFAALAELYIARGGELHEIWHRGMPTLIHGDPHIGNLFFDADDRVGFLDWGIVNVNTPMRDVGYLLAMALTVDDRRAHERDLLAHYLDVAAALGATPIAWDDAWAAHRVHAAYTVPASCQVVTFPADASPRRQVFAAAFLERAEAAIADLDALGAVQQLLA